MRRPTSRPTVAKQVVRCTGSTCECDGTRPCSLQCTATDACIESTLVCPVDFACDVTCGDKACNKALVVGPNGADFSLLCEGTASCGDAQVQSERARDVLYRCGGKDACKGAGTQINCGAGLCALVFSGEASGDSATIHTNGALGFSCEGRYAACPDNYEPPCTKEAAGSSCTAAQTLELRTRRRAGAGWRVLRVRRARRSARRRACRGGRARAWRATTAVWRASASRNGRGCAGQSRRRRGVRRSPMRGVSGTRARVCRRRR